MPTNKQDSYVQTILLVTLKRSKLYSCLDSCLKTKQDMGQTKSEQKDYEKHTLTTAI